MTTWIPICTVQEIPVLGARRVSRAKGPDVALFRTSGDQIHALLDRCPHRAGPLSQGIVFGAAVACPLHNWTIALDTGCAREPDEGRTPVFRVKVEAGQVWLDGDELATVAVDLLPVQAGPCTRVNC
ncbi:nitrite reductase small subunit NirD [Roseateles terrae]|uniref:Nitrite reductase (NADH) small subunit n=1 Tax=Roseateles terrae TaxID=431060 RepID=A0ABR6GYN2_9BURK|nr:nitrite reductase small subunit NirD [Roseateles terrae]MBB3197224.1 nitrite reductase (NADH) small subunit [Roseateles terrae]OWQ83710.1 nitrite reductase (NAD(P)H) small subunit [Roseateles terrae]